jgi:hypothetical protein
MILENQNPFRNMISIVVALFRVYIHFPVGQAPRLTVGGMGAAFTVYKGPQAKACGYKSDSKFS